MGVLNITPDSFSDGGKFLAIDAALTQAQQLVADGADWLDIGGQSSHPSSPVVSAETEWQRIAPLFPRVTQLGVPVAVDTYKSEVARRALAAGATMINDITALRADPAMAAVLAASDCQICLMFNKSDGLRASFAAAKYADPIAEITAFFDQRIAFCAAAGIAPERLVLDPGMGFFLSSDPTVSREVLCRLPELVARFAQPIYVGISRKSFVCTDADPHARSVASLPFELQAIADGAGFLRTHEPKLLYINNAVFLSLGANLDTSPADNILTAIERLKSHCEIIKISPIIITPPWGKTDQPDFANAVVQLDPRRLSPHELLIITQQIEQEMGRKRGEKWGPRVIDIDIIYWGRRQVDDGERLQIPHPLALQREFVLRPLAAIAPDFMPPAQQQTVAELLANMQ